MHVLQKKINNNINGTGLANKLKFNVYHGNFFFKNSQRSYGKHYRYSLLSTLDERGIALFEIVEFARLFDAIACANLVFYQKGNFIFAFSR